MVRLRQADQDVEDALAFYSALRTKALANAEVKAEYEKLADQFSLLDEFLKARAAIAGNTDQICGCFGLQA